MNPKSWTGVKGCPNLSYSPQSILDLSLYFCPIIVSYLMNNIFFALNHLFYI